MIGYILIAVAVLIGLLVLYYFNKIVVLGNRIDNAWSQIDVQLKKRADLVPNLVETVKGYMKHEAKVFKEVTEARTRFLNASTPQQKVKAGTDMGNALKTIFAVAENYPKLEASENFKMLQEELSGIENKIAYARQFYNDSVLVLNNVITTIPGLWFAALFGKGQKKEYLEISASERQNVKVKFD